jgi:sulfite oxidase
MVGSPVIHSETLANGSRNWDLHVTSSAHRVKVFSINTSRAKSAATIKLYEKKGIPFLPITQPGVVEMEDEETYLSEMKARGGRDPKE